jgi:predicted cytidylate kinase
MVTITISGTPGSGKSTVAKILEKKLSLKYVYSGDIFRDMAKEYNMSLEEFGKFCEENKEIDEKLDDHQLEILKIGKVILEGRISGWIAYRNKIPAFKVWLDAKLDVRAKRIVKRENGDVENRKQEIITREKSEATRYKKYYNIDVKDLSIYDIIIDTVDKTPVEIAGMIIDKINK